MRESDRNAKTQRVTFEQVLRQFRKYNFAVLSTVAEDGTADSAGVNYGLAGRDAEFAIYVMTRRHLKKARNIARNPNVSLVIPLARRLLWFLPPPCIQVSGRMGRRILAMYEDAHQRGETRTDHPRPRHLDLHGRIQRVGVEESGRVGGRESSHTARAVARARH